MTIQLSWYNDDHRILVMTIVDRWHWRDMQPIIEEIEKIGRARTEPFDLIVDGHKSTLYEPNLVDFLRNRPARAIPGKRRLLILVGLDEFTKILWNGVTQMPFASHLQAHYFDTVDEAVKFSEQYTEGSASQNTGEPKADGGSQQ